MKDLNRGLYTRAIEVFRQLKQAHPQQLAVTFALARCYALRDDTEEALDMLDDVQKSGFASRSLITDDAAFKSLQKQPRYQTIIDQMENLPDGVIPSRSFSSQQYWAKNGWPNGTDTQGKRYLLSSVLAVTGKNQSTLEGSLARLRSSAAVDGTNPVANVYFAANPGVRTKVRLNQFEAAKQELESLGRTATIGTGLYPKGDQHVMGATLGHAKPDWSESGSRFQPGAICDNLTSFGGWWGRPGQTQLSEYLDAGAAGASGTVCEPFAVAGKFPTARWHAHYARGCTLVESLFQSVAGPSQLLLVGDPLCCPFGKFPDFKITGLSPGDTVTDNFTLQIKRKLNSPAVKHFELFYDGVFLNKLPDPNQVQLTVSGTSDGYHEIRIVGVSDTPVANRHSEKISFFIKREEAPIRLEIENPVCDIEGKLKGRVVSSIKQKIRILSNSRTIATVENQQDFDIPASALGIGEVNLQAVADLAQNQTIASKPVLVTLFSSAPTQQEILARLKTNQTYTQLATGIWKVVWKNGRTWDSLTISPSEYYEEPKLVIISEGKTLEQSFKDNGRGSIESWNASRSVGYSFSYSNDRIRCVTTSAKTGRQIEGVGVLSTAKAPKR